MSEITGKAVEQLPRLSGMSREEIDQFIGYCGKERGVQEGILRDAKEDEDVADVLARIKELGRWLKEAREELGTRPVEQQPRRLLSLEQLEAEAGREIQWLIQGLRLPVGGSCLIAGPPGIGKSFLALHAAVSVAAGEDFLRHYPTMQGSVVYVDEESSPQAFNMRLFLLRNGSGLELGALPLWVGVKEGFLLDQEEVLDELIELLRPLKPSLLILDALIRLHRGDENSAKDAGRVTKALSRIQREMGCAIILIQHQRKEGLIKSRRDVVRGSSEWTAWPDSVITLERSGSNHEAYILKSRFTEDGQVMVYEQFINEEEAILEFVREEEAQASREEKAKRIIAELFTDDRVWNHQELFAAAKPMGFGRPTVLYAVTALGQDETIRVWRGARGAYHYQKRDSDERVDISAPQFSL